MADFGVDDAKIKDLKMSDPAKQAASNILRDQVFNGKVNKSRDLADALAQIREERDTNQDGLVNKEELHAGSQMANDFRRELKNTVERLAKQTEKMEKMLKEKKITFGPPQTDQSNDPKSAPAKPGEQKKSSAEPKTKSTIKEEGKQKAPDRKSEAAAVKPLDVAKELGVKFGGPTIIRIEGVVVDEAGELKPVMGEMREPKGDSKLIVAASKLETLDRAEAMQQQMKDLHNDGEVNNKGISANDIDDLRSLPYATEGLAKLTEDFAKIKGSNNYITDTDILKYVQKNKLDEFTKTCISRARHHLEDNEHSGKYSKEFIQRIHNQLLNLKISD